MSYERRNGTETHSADEVERAIRALAPADHKRLEAAAWTLFWSLGLKTASRDPEDLVAEAYARTFSGSRAWRRGIDFVRHLTETMRSIAWTWKERQDSELEEFSIDPFDEDLRELEGTAHLPPGLYAPVRDPERHLILRDGLLAFERHFADDERASEVIGCWTLGMKGPEIRERTGMSERELRAAVRRIRRFAEQGVSDGH